MVNRPSSVERDRKAKVNIMIAYETYETIAEIKRETGKTIVEIVDEAVREYAEKLRGRGTK